MAGLALGDSKRLVDVLALIQVLGVGDAPNRTNRALHDDIFLKGPQSAAETWAKIALQHPEFFRVAGEARDNIRLVARYAAGTLSEEFDYDADDARSTRSGGTRIPDCADYQERSDCASVKKMP